MNSDAEVEAGLVSMTRDPLDGSFVPHGLATVRILVERGFDKLTKLGRMLRKRS